MDCKLVLLGKKTEIVKFITVGLINEQIEITHKKGETIADLIYKLGTRLTLYSWVDSGQKSSKRYQKYLINPDVTGSLWNSTLGGWSIIRKEEDYLCSTLFNAPNIPLEYLKELKKKYPGIHFFFSYFGRDSDLQGIIDLDDTKTFVQNYPQQFFTWENMEPLIRERLAEYQSELEQLDDDLQEQIITDCRELVLSDALQQTIKKQIGKKR